MLTPNDSENHNNAFDVHPDEWQQILPPTSLDNIPKPPDITSRTWFEMKRWAETEEPGITKKLFLGHSKSGNVVMKRDVTINDIEKVDTDDTKSEA